ncbi:PP2C family protein-serine/threonine phosphatase [Christiangramia sp. SM2212]|uniref:Protein phosphatase 2C domain-containing protein n=1 Tax=Christiangramia sediminicola TaxID=3073267 RepID=A0ABU1ESF2_9FLAO|nr:protein phosphatase 2C domain-containing protein [Christiangramia sp. SM2212]MDR5591320.1 protein phosphatase 2C domain-containing protein [Christiangramia sp. SM2212]
MKSTIISHIGKRKINQDFTLVKSINADTFLYLIADGMGGYDNGDVAASIVIDSVSTFLTNTKELNENAIKKAINKANLAVRQYQEQHHSKLGSTLGGIIVSGETARAFWVGDVKILHYSKSKLSFESKPHNLKNELSEADDSIDNLDFSKYNHVVTRSIQGDVKKSEPSFQKFLLNKGDKVFVCSDGVHNIMDSLTLQYLLNINETSGTLLDTIDQRLIEEANDNASLILIEDFSISG